MDFFSERTSQPRTRFVLTRIKSVMQKSQFLFNILICSILINRTEAKPTPNSKREVSGPIPDLYYNAPFSDALQREVCTDSPGRSADPFHEDNNNDLDVKLARIWWPIGFMVWRWSVWYVHESISTFVDKYSTSVNKISVKIWPGLPGQTSSVLGNRFWF